MSAFHESARKIIQTDIPTVRKSIMIGLGGSGMRGIGSARQYIEKNMPGEARPYMRWVGVDTTDIGTSIEGQGDQYRFPGENQHYQEERRTLYIASPTPAELSTEYLRKLREDEVYHWFPDPDVYTVSTRAGQGANQTRPLGRLAFFHNYQNIRRTLIAERDRLMQLSNDPQYFQLMDLQEKSDVVAEDVVVRPVPGQNRYYIVENLPSHHDIISLEMDEASRATLCPHIAADKIKPQIFPKDHQGLYFEVNPERAPAEMKFRVRHAAREAGISIFITGSIVGGTGNGMFIDMAALVHDIFKDVWPRPKVYGIVVLPSAFKRVVYNRNARANAYAALKEIDYYMSGNLFEAKYPGGVETKLENRLFNDGMLYLLDVENSAGNVLQDRDQVQELTGQFIYTFVASNAGGAIEERMVNDSSRASIYFPTDGPGPRRRASYNSFGISRVTYPAPELRDLGYKLVSLRLIQNFRRRVKPEKLSIAFGNMNRGLVRALRLNCRQIFDRMYPDYKLDWETEFNSYKLRIKKALAKRDGRELVSSLELLQRDYGRGEMDRLKERLLQRMEVRWRIELDKTEQILEKVIEKVLKDPAQGFLFCRALLDQVMEKLEAYQDVYYDHRTNLEYYTEDEIRKLIGDLDEGEWKPRKADAVFYMVRINYLQLIYESMLQASEEFVREFKSLIYRLKNDLLVPLEDKLVTLGRQLQSEVQHAHFELLQKVNPLYFYLVSKKEIQNFINEYFARRLSIEDLSSDADFLNMDRGDDAEQLIQTYLIGEYGLSVLEKTPAELQEFIIKELGSEILNQTPDEVRKRLYGDLESEQSLTIADSTMNRIEIENLRLGLYRVIRKRFEGFNFENLSIKKILDERKIPVKKILERLDTFSRPYTTANMRGLKGMEYYRTITQFELNVFEEGDVAPARNKNDLPARMDHYAKRQAAEPNISVETFEVPNLCKPYEMISIGILLGFPLFRLDTLNDSAADYHAILGDRSHPMHLFNHPTFDARYFPDPFRDRNYLNPKHLWGGLVQFELLAQGEGGYAYSETLYPELKSMEARENYFGPLKKIIQQVNADGGVRKCNLDLFTNAVLGMGMLKKSKQGKLKFRSDYDLVIRDIIDGDGTGDRAVESGLSKDEYVRKFIPSPEFAGEGDLKDFLKQHRSVRDFLSRDAQRIFDASMGNVQAGAALQIPRSRIEATKLPVFEDEFAFYDYFEGHGSLEWQNFLKTKLVEAVEKQVRRFRLPDDPTLLDRGKIRGYLSELGDRLPFIVSWEVQVNTGVIK
ncbi:MAG: tubulin-like doman-containing protein [bacterium]|nr:tubulin-like doman-containing protein [bacterium]